MNIPIVFLSLIFTVVISGNAIAVGPGKTLEFKGSNLGTVLFDGTKHKNAGLTCPDCHNSNMFPKMKQGTVKMSMNDLYAGKYCGKCHDGKSAFLIKGHCSNCHRMSRRIYGRH